MTNNSVDKMGDDSALRRSLKEKSDFFKRMVNLIPAKYYLDKETKRTGERFFKNMKEEAPRQQLKEKSTKLSRKKQRMDPDAKQALQVTDLQDALAKREEERERRRQEKMRQEAEQREEEEEEEEEDEKEESSGDEMDGLEGGLQGLGESDDKDWSQPKVVEPVSVERIHSNASIDDLRRKVQEKIELLRQKRNAKSLEGNAVMSKKVAKKVKEANEKKLRKQETYKAIKASKERKRQEKEKQRTQNGSQAKGKQEEGDAEEDGNKVQDQSKVSFSKFYFEEESTAGASGKKKKKKKNKRKGGEEKLSGRDFEGLLKKVQAKKQKIAEVKKSDPDAAENMIKQDQWRAALDRAQGKKVRDDPELLKKSIRKKKEKKKHSEKKWTERENRTKDLKEERQKKRRTNLKGRKDARTAKKVKRLQKKGKLLLKDSDYN